MNADFFGYAGTVINLVMLLPQLVRTWKTKQTRDLSLTTISLFLIACVLWMAYGIAKNAVPVVIANIVMGTMNVILLATKLRYPEKN